MDDLQTNQNIKNDPEVQAALLELNALLEEAKKDAQEFDEAIYKRRNEVEKIEAEVDGSVRKLEQIFSELNGIEKDAESELDQLILKRTEELANDGDEDET